MKNSKQKLIALGIFTLISSTTFGQGDLGIRGNPNASDQAPANIDLPQPSGPPSEAQIRYEVGNAPFYVNLASYARFLNRFYVEGNDRILDGEAEALGISRTDLESVVVVLNGYRDLELKAWDSRQRALCQPILVGQDVSNEYAKDALAQLDDDVDERNAIAQSVLNQVEGRLGVAVVNSVEDRIAEVGKTIDFTKMDTVKFVESLPDTDHREFFTRQCKAL